MVTANLHLSGTAHKCQPNEVYRIRKKALWKNKDWFVLQTGSIYPCQFVNKTVEPLSVLNISSPFYDRKSKNSIDRWRCHEQLIFRIVQYFYFIFSKGTASVPSVSKTTQTPMKTENWRVRSRISCTLHPLEYVNHQLISLLSAFGSFKKKSNTPLAPYINRISLASV